MKKHQLKNNGFVALLGVMVVTAIGLTVSVTLLASGSFTAQNSKILEDKYEARTLADACAEKALANIQVNTSYTGSENLNIGAGSCSFLVIDAGGSNREINSEGIVGNSIVRLKVLVNQVVPQVVTSSWQEVSSF